MTPRIKNALIFGILIMVNSLVTYLFIENNPSPRKVIINISITLIVAIIGAYIFGFVLKGSFGWKNENERKRNK